MAFCQNCGNQIPDGASHCPNCGAAAGQQQPMQQQTFQQAPSPNQQQWQTMPNQNAQPPKKKGKGCLIVILVFVGLIILSSVVRAIKGKNSTGNDVPTSPETHEETEPVKEETKNSEKQSTTKPVTKTPETEEQPVETEPEETDEPELSASEIQQMIKNGDYSLVTPEFKDYLDSYEAFMDDYVAFMKKYNSGEGDIMAMMNDYMDMLTKMQEWSAKIDAIDEAELSIADDAYYLLVTVRVEKKLLSVI